MNFHVLVADDEDEVFAAGPAVTGGFSYPLVHWMPSWGRAANVKIRRFGMEIQGLLCFPSLGNPFRRACFIVLALATTAHKIQQKKFPINKIARVAVLILYFKGVGISVISMFKPSPHPPNSKAHAREVSEYQSLGP